MDLEYEKKLAAAHTGQQKKVPGNDGGETFRQYCGLSAHRRVRYKDCCFDNCGLSAHWRARYKDCCFDNCGLSAHRRARYKDCCFDNGGVSAQRLFIAIGKHQKKKGGKE